MMYGNEYEGERALPVASNHLLKLAPALILKYQVSYAVTIEAGTAYHFLSEAPGMAG